MKLINDGSCVEIKNLLFILNRQVYLYDTLDKVKQRSKQRFWCQRCIFILNVNVFFLLIKQSFIVIVSKLFIYQE